MGSGPACNSCHLNASWPGKTAWFVRSQTSRVCTLYQSLCLSPHFFHYLVLLAVLLCTGPAPEHALASASAVPFLHFSHGATSSQQLPASPLEHPQHTIPAAPVADRPSIPTSATSTPHLNFINLSSVNGATLPPMALHALFPAACLHDAKCTWSLTICPVSVPMAAAAALQLWGSHKRAASVEPHCYLWGKLRKEVHVAMSCLLWVASLCCMGYG